LKTRESKLVPIGSVSKPHGIKGELVVALNYSDIEIDKNLRIIWLGDSPNHIHPWKIETYRLGEKRIFLKLRDVNSLEEAKYLEEIKVFLPQNLIQHTAFSEILNFTVFDSKTQKQVGIVKSIDLTNPQILMLIETGKNELMLPIVDEFVKEIDQAKKRISVELIEGFGI